MKQEGQIRPMNYRRNVKVIRVTVTVLVGCHSEFSVIRDVILARKIIMELMMVAQITNHRNRKTSVPMFTDTYVDYALFVVLQM